MSWRAGCPARGRPACSHREGRCVSAGLLWNWNCGQSAARPRKAASTPPKPRPRPPTHHTLSTHPPTRHIVQRRLQPGREAVVHPLPKVLAQEGAQRPAQRLRVQRPGAAGGVAAGLRSRGWWVGGGGWLGGAAAGRGGRRSRGSAQWGSACMRAWPAVGMPIPLGCWGCQQPAWRLATSQHGLCTMHLGLALCGGAGECGAAPAAPGHMAASPSRHRPHRPHRPPASGMHLSRAAWTCPGGMPAGAG